MTISTKPKSIWDAIGKIFRGNKKEIPEGMDFCENCGRIFPKEDLHQIIAFFGSKQDFIICDECSDLPPSEWRRNYARYRRN